MRYLLRETATEREIWVQFLEAYDVRAADFVLVRPTALPPDRAEARAVSHVCFTTPYVCEGVSYAAWRDYFERAAGELGVRLDAASYRRVMRGEGNPRRWLDFVFEGYTGQRALNVVQVAGIPDLPHTLQHHEDFDEDQADAIPPGADPTTRSQILISRGAAGGVSGGSLRLGDARADEEHEEHEELRLGGGDDGGLVPRPLRTRTSKHGWSSAPWKRSSLSTAWRTGSATGSSMLGFWLPRRVWLRWERR